MTDEYVQKMKKYLKKAANTLVAFLCWCSFVDKVFKYLRTSDQLLNLREILTFKVLIFSQTRN